MHDFGRVHLRVFATASVGYRADSRLDTSGVIRRHGPAGASDVAFWVVRRVDGVARVTFPGRAANAP